MNTTSLTVPTASSRQSRVRTRLAGVAGAVAAASGVWALAVVVLDVDLQVSPGGEPQRVGLGMVIGASLLACMLGWALLAGLERRTRRARTVWVAVAAVVLLASLAAPVTAAATPAAAITLIVLHLVVGAVLVPVLHHSSPTT